MELKNRRLQYYSGNYDQYVKTKAELEEHQMKRYQQEQEQIASMKDYIARFGHGQYVFQIIVIYSFPTFKVLCDFFLVISNFLYISSLAYSFLKYPGL